MTEADTPVPVESTTITEQGGVAVKMSTTDGEIRVDQRYCQSCGGLQAVLEIVPTSGTSTAPQWRDVWPEPCQTPGARNLLQMIFERICGCGTNPPPS